MMNTSRQDLLTLIDGIIADEQLACDKRDIVWSFSSNTAKSIVHKIFRGDLRRSQEPTLTHIFTVSGMDAKGEFAHFMPEEERIIRLFHDLFEDTELEISDGETWGMKTDTLIKIDILTRGEDDLYFDYIVALGHDPLCVDIKLDDIQDNLDLSENLTLIRDVEKTQRKMIANNYLKAVKTDKIPAGYSPVSFVDDHYDKGEQKIAHQIVEKYFTYPPTNTTVPSNTISCILN
ncbi:MAG: hypothetical protein JKY11_08550 [Alphaproteobacteria bacterium]|nr:hypothetical protein [Alphaproteobacteria bacterium]